MQGCRLAVPMAARVVRVGHLHITVDDLPWLWADFGQSNTIVLAGMPRGQHKVLIELVDAEGNVFTAQTVTFHSPGQHSLRALIRPIVDTVLPLNRAREDLVRVRSRLICKSRCCFPWPQHRRGAR